MKKGFWESDDYYCDYEDFLADFNAWFKRGKIDPRKLWSDYTSEEWDYYLDNWEYLAGSATCLEDLSDLDPLFRKYKKGSFASQVLNAVLEYAYNRRN